MRIGFYLLLGGLLLAGCVSKEEVVTHHVIEVETPKPYQFELKPNIGSRNDDSRTVVDMGVVMKIWVKNYKNRQGNLIASHDLYAWARKPDFLVGEDLPPRRNTSLVTPVQKLPFMLTGEEIDRSDIQNDEVIKEYVNKVYENERDPELAQKRLDASRESDKKILEFLKQIKGENE